MSSLKSWYEILNTGIIYYMQLPNYLKIVFAWRMEI